MKMYPLIAAAVAAATASVAAVAAPPSLTQAANPAVKLVIAGSSAAKSAILTAVKTGVCGGAANALEIDSAGNKNFNAVSCQATAATGLTAGTLVTVYYRSEGGSVTGALPIVTGYQPYRLNLADGSCSASGTTGTCTVTGSSSANGLNDSFTGAVAHDPVDLGVTDVEPGQLTNDNYPVDYAQGTWGHATTADMVNLSTAPAVQQVFGIAVDTHNVTLNTAVNGAGVHLSRESVANILNGTYTDWTKVPDALTGAPVATGGSGTGITVVNRERGSGTRTSVNMYFFGYQCGSTSSITADSGTSYFATGDALTRANAVDGAVTYASIDNLPNASYPNLVFASINGVVPSNLAAAAGAYDFWYEATLVQSPNTTGNAATLMSYLVGAIPDLNSAPQQADINVIPFASANNTATVPLTSTGSPKIYVNPFTRSGNSCNVPAALNF